MGSVWRAEHFSLNSQVAVKLVDPEIIAQPEATARFLREAQAAAALRSPHVVQIFDYGVDAEVPYIVMELLEGESLATRLELQGKLPAAATAEILSQVCRAVSRAHEHGVVHRDLKPDNIFITANDDVEIAKVLDFGIAKHVLPGSHGMTHTGAVLGTPYYMSPEQVEGARDVDFRTDLWALSVIAYQCIVGKRPFDEESLGGLILAICTRPLPRPSAHGDVPAGFDEWFAQGVARDKQRRFASARELASSLRAVCGLVDASRAGVARDGFVSGDKYSDAPPRDVERLARTSAASSLARSIEDMPPELPMKRQSGIVKALLALLVVVAVGAVWLLRPTRPSSDHALALPASAPNLEQAIVAASAAIIPLALPSAQSADAAVVASATAQPLASSRPSLSANPSPHGVPAPNQPKKPGTGPAKPLAGGHPATHQATSPQVNLGI